MRPKIGRRRLTHLSEAVQPRTVYVGTPGEFPIGVHAMLVRRATIAVALLATSLLALASVQAAAETQRGGGMAAGNKAGGPGTQRVGPRTPNAKGKKYKGQTPPTQSQPYCPYGKKADGTCWVRCRYTICL